MLWRYKSVGLVSFLPDVFVLWLSSDDGCSCWPCNLFLIKRYTPRLSIPPMFENVVTVWWIAGGMLPGLIDTQIPNIAKAHHWKMKASTNSDIARTAACLILLADDCFPSEVFSLFSMERSFAHVSTYSVVFTTKITDRGRVVKRNWRNWPFTPSKKHLKQMQIEFLETFHWTIFKMCFTVYFIFSSYAVVGNMKTNSKKESTYEEPFGPSSLVAREITDNRKGSPKIQRSRRQSRRPNSSCLLKIMSMKAFTATMLTISVWAVINSRSITP